MFILNKKTKVIQECHNADVIKVCRKDANNYTVAATRAELEGKGSQEPQEQPENSKAEENTNEEPKAAPEGKSEAQGGNSEEGKAPEGENEAAAGGKEWKNLSEEEKVAALEAMKVEELRKIAKEEGIQGYSNMNKDTLVAMIMNH